MTYTANILDIIALNVRGLDSLPKGNAPASSAKARTPSQNAATLARAKRGHSDALAALVNDLQDVWFRYCMSMLRNPEQARDAAQETALRFVRDLKRFRGDSKLRTWSLGIATNVCRERRRQRKTLALSSEHANADTAPGPAQCAQLKEQRDRLLATLSDLPERQREAVVLRYFEQLSVKDTARAMGCAPGTVKATLSQAIRSLRQRLGAGHE